MKLVPQLSFNGTCQSAFRFYEKVFGGKISFLMTYGETPMANHFGPEWNDKVIHATLDINGMLLQGADAPPQHFSQPQGFSICFDVEDPSEADRTFQALSEGGKVTMPIQETFWARRFGMAVDQFGIPWMVNCGKPLGGNPS
jgi:PhnB protein